MPGEMCLTARGERATGENRNSSKKAQSINVAPDWRGASQGLRGRSIEPGPLAGSRQGGIFFLPLYILSHLLEISIYSIILFLIGFCGISAALLFCLTRTYLLRKLIWYNCPRSGKPRFKDRQKLAFRGVIYG